MAKMDVEINITNTEIFMKLINLLSSVATDKDISAEKRMQIGAELDKIIEEVNS